ncbi:MAG TPA: hypothetical protein VMV27_07215 [Candidatus Binataceae bacterium]|nr:hypothetical protein [Candidatus Binataceae bacterium]
MTAILIVAACGASVADIDLWGHLRFGLDALARGSIATRDPYAYSIPGLPWVSHEWLSEIIFAWMYAKLGVLGLKLVRLACAAAMIICLAGAVGETGARIEVQLAVLIAAAIALAPEMEFRPQAFSYALLAGTMWLLARENFRPRAPLWLAIPMLALWSNLHGGFVTGLAALGIFTACVGLADLRAGRGLARALRPALVTVASAAASLATPYGFGTWISVLRTLSHPPMMNEIVEWKPLPAAMIAIWHMPGWALLFDVIVVLLFAGLIAAVAAAPRGGDFPLVAIAAVMITAGVSALRNVPLGIIGCVTPLTRHLGLALGAVPGAQRARSGAAPQRGRSGPWAETTLAILAVFVAIKIGVFSRRMEIPFTFPAGAVAFMRQHQLSGNILCKFSWDDYVLYHCWPECHVFLDTRYEMIYPDRIAREYEDFYHDRADAAGVLNGYPNNYVMLDPAAPAVALMNSSPGWKLIYQDPVALLYARADSAAASLAVVNAARPAAPREFP